VLVFSTIDLRGGEKNGYLYSIARAEKENWRGERNTDHLLLAGQRRVGPTRSASLCSTAARRRRGERQKEKKAGLSRGSPTPAIADGGERSQKRIILRRGERELSRISSKHGASIEEKKAGLPAILTGGRKRDREHRGKKHLLYDYYRASSEKEAACRLLLRGKKGRQEKESQPSSRQLFQKKRRGKYIYLNLVEERREIKPEVAAVARQSPRRGRRSAVFFVELDGGGDRVTKRKTLTHYYLCLTKKAPIFFATFAIETRLKKRISSHYLLQIGKKRRRSACISGRKKGGVYREGVSSPPSQFPIASSKGRRKARRCFFPEKRKKKKKRVV